MIKNFKNFANEIGDIINFSLFKKYEEDFNED